MESCEHTAEVRPVKSRRVGTFTFGIILVLCGILMLVELFFPQVDLLWVLKLSPLALVSLGVEVLLASRKSSSIKYDWVGMILCALVVTVALCLFSAAWWIRQEAEGNFGPRFSGSRTGSETSLVLEYGFFNGEEIQHFTLEAGDVLQAAVDNSSGSVGFSLVEEDSGEVVWDASKLAQASFEIDIPDTGAYELTVWGEQAQGQASFTLAEA